MPFPSALTTDNYTALRGTSYSALSFAAFLPNTVVFQALVNGAPTGASYAQVTFDNVTVGAFGDIVEGQTVLIGADSSMRNAIFVGRVRKVPTSSILYINETSVEVPDNANIWVIQDYRIFDRLARISSGVELKDYDLTWELTPPIVTGLQSYYAGIVSGSPLGYSQHFQAIGLPLASGATITTYHWIIPSGATITSGSVSTSAVTIRFDSGFNDYVGITVTDSNAKSSTFWFWVVAVAKDFSNVVTLQAVNPSVNAGENGWSGSIDAFDGVTTLLDNNAIMIFDVERYNGTVGSIFSNVKFGGRIRIEADDTRGDIDHGLLRKVTFTLEGVAEQLSRIEHLPFTLVNDSTPSAWDEIKDLSVVRAVFYSLWWHSTLLTVHSVSTYTNDLNDDRWKYPLLPTQGGNILSIIQDLMVSINGNFQSCATGECQIVRNALYLNTLQRAALTTVANFTEADGIDFQLTHTEVDTSGKVQASGGYFTSVNNKVTALLSLAPGSAQGIGENIVNFARQILQANGSQALAQAELNDRSGSHFAIVAREADILNVTMRGGYNWIQPSINQWYTWTLPANFTRGARAYTTADRWQCVSSNVGYDAAGTHSVQASFKLESIGVAGDTVTYPTQGSIPQSLPVTPVSTPYPSLSPLSSISLPDTPVDADTPPYTIPTPLSDGNWAIFGSASQVWTTNKLMLTNEPPTNEVTPSDGLIYTAAEFLEDGTLSCYVLANDGIDSHFFYSANPFLSPPVWVETVLSGKIYTDIRVDATSGSVAICGNTPSASTCAVNWDLVDGDHGTITDRDDTTIVVEATQVGGPSGDYFVILTIDGSLSTPSDDLCTTIPSRISSSGEGTESWVECGGAYPLDFHTGLFGGQCSWYYQIQDDVPFSVTITFSTVDECGDCATPETNEAFSTDYGATFSSPQSPSGTSLSGNVGFDILRVGDQTLIGEVGQVQIATTGGGSYADYGDPVPTGAAPNFIKLPRFHFGGTVSNINTSIPQYLLGSGVLTAGNEAFWKVTASGVTFTDVTPHLSAEYGLIAGPNAGDIIYRNSSKWAAIFDFGATRKLATTINAGTSWSDRGAINPSAKWLRVRKLDITQKQIVIANGTDGILVSSTFGSSLKVRIPPTEDSIDFISLY